MIFLKTDILRKNWRPYTWAPQVRQERYFREVDLSNEDSNSTEGGHPLKTHIFLQDVQDLMPIIPSLDMIDCKHM